MFVDLRTYTMVPGRLKAFLTLYEAEGLPVQVRHQGPPIGYFTTETGTHNQVVHLWGYESAADRERKRDALEKDPDWAAYRQKSGASGNVQHQENKLLRSVSFSPL
ncbi:MAG: NIPSNAP family protein [Pseudomonadota bacterium]|nr:NIPSNAP family protein [Pseudomonadota bacterium]